MCVYVYNNDSNINTISANRPTAASGAAARAGRGLRGAAAALIQYQRIRDQNQEENQEDKSEYNTAALIQYH